MLSSDQPTVSHIVSKHPIYGQDCWKIIHAAANRGKPFDNLQAGSRVELDPLSGELFITAPAQAPARQSQAAAPPPEMALSAATARRKRVVRGMPASAAALAPSVKQTIARPQQGADGGDLAQAVGAYHGRSYRQLNCYQLVVRGLEDLGVQYGGAAGLQARLIDKAREQGLAENAYLTGEGLIETAAHEVYRGDFQAGKATEQVAEKAWRELESRLEPGMLLSFSAGKRGHTGVIARHQGRWTLINSGRIHQDVHGLARFEGVGEEELRNEIASWLKLAARNGSTLRIVVGQLSPEKLAAFTKQAPVKLFA